VAPPKNAQDGALASAVRSDEQAPAWLASEYATRAQRAACLAPGDRCMFNPRSTTFGSVPGSPG
jgi:hypothetical protein